MTTTQRRRAAGIDQLRTRLARPVDSAVLAYFRIAFGAVMVWEMWRFLDPDHGWVDRYYTDKDLYFDYGIFTFVDPLPEPWIHLVFVATMLAAGLVTVGLFYRFAASAMFVGLSYIFLLEQARYLNHFYLIVLLAFLMPWLPANAAYSVDARRRPETASQAVPAWTVWLVMFQVGVPYFFGGIAKLNADWLRGEPLRAWLAARTDFPVIGGLFVHEPVVWAMTYGALALDLTVVFFLLRRRTRVFAFMAAVTFHLMNSRLFGIGVFPWLMIPATAIFFEPDWPRRVLADLRNPGAATTRVRGLLVGAAVGGFFGAFLPETVSLWRAAIGALGVAIGGYHLAAQWQQRQPSVDRTSTMPNRDSDRHPLATPTMVLLGLWVAVQVLVPLRHLVVPGDVHWTEEGHTFSWHMKLRDKDADADFTVVADGQEFPIDLDDYLTSRQESKMEARPRLMVQFAHHLYDEFRLRGHRGIRVHVDAFASLNGREDQRFIDPDVDLAAESALWFGHRDWILPLETPLRPGASGSPDGDED